MFVVLCGVTAGGIIPARTYVIVTLGMLSLYYHPNLYQHSFKPLLIIIASFFTLYILHLFYYNYNDERFFDKIMLILSGFFIIKQLGREFRYLYLKAMVFFSVVSLVCYFLDYIGITLDIPYFYESSINEYHGIFIWNVRYNEMFNSGFGRNCGPFWEPGAYAGYLLLILVLYFEDMKYLWIKYKKECIILLIALVSTFSTQGYVCAFLIFICKILSIATKRNILILGFVLLTGSLISLYIYESSFFLKDKIEKQYEVSQTWNKNINKMHVDRFSTTMLDVENIANNPYIGNTSDGSILYGRYPSLFKQYRKYGSIGSGSGMTSFMAQNGIPILMIWLILVFKSLKVYYGNSKSAVLICVCLMALGQCESYIGQIFYLSIPFLDKFRIRHEKY